MPEMGNWILNVIGVSVQGTEEYVASVSGYSDIQLDIVFDSDIYFETDSVLVTTMLSNEDMPITGANVTAEIDENLLTLTPAEDWNGEVEITVTVSDGIDSDSEVFTFGSRDLSF